MLTGIIIGALFIGAPAGFLVAALAGASRRGDRNGERHVRQLEREGYELHVIGERQGHE